MSKRQHILLTAMEYSALQLFRFMALALPMRAALRMGECLGILAAAVTRKRRRLAVANILQAFPHMSQEQAEALAMRVFQHFARGAVEVVRAHRMLRPGNFEQHVIMHHEERFSRILAARQGAIWVSAHFGLWEIFGLYAGTRDAQVTSVYRSVKNPWIDRFVRRQRSDTGQKLVERRGALKELLRALRKERHHVVMLVDQHVRRDGVWAPFFGRPSATTPGPALLALRTGAPIIIWYSRRLPGTFRFEAWCDEPIRVIPSDDRAADIKRITFEISRRLEEFIRETPEQWLWFHRRWHEPPPEVMEKEPANVHCSVKTV